VGLKGGGCGEENEAVRLEKGKGGGLESSEAPPPEMGQGSHHRWGGEGGNRGL
jgi:hypothetical protein